MADDKGGSSGGWEAFEVIIVILLAIGLLSRLQGKPIVDDTTKPATIKQVDNTPITNDTTCGLVLERPHPLEKVTTFVTLAGSTFGCQWPSAGSIALYAQVVDSRGKPVSEYTAVAGNSSYDTASGTMFSATIAITATPASGTGYLILIPAKSASDHSISQRIPIQFKK